ncbi:MAG: hypothetical protein LBJ44_00510 [Propionibacteriaceae bacterium]|jgi:biotin transport system permease protein|nr:hypothetical protein [Propionibacteriaceae bacterium]
MAKADRLLGVYQPAGSAIEAWPIPLKYAVALALSLPACLLQRWWLTLACLALALALTRAAGLRPGRAWALPPVFLGLIVVLALVHALTDGWLIGLVVVGNLALALYAARLVVMTTSAPRLIDALVRAVGPLARFGFPGRRFGWAVLVMVRSVPYLAGSLAAVREAALARGLRGRLGPQISQVVVRAVGYAQATGDAMAARGLEEGDD